MPAKFAPGAKSANDGPSGSVVRFEMEQEF